MIIYVRPRLQPMFIELVQESYKVGTSFVHTSLTHFNISDCQDELGELAVLVDLTSGPGDYWLTDSDINNLKLIPREARWAYLLDLGKPHD